MSEKLRRRSLHDRLVEFGVDPTTEKALDIIDNYRPTFVTQNELHKAYSIEAIMEWSKGRFPG